VRGRVGNSVSASVPRVGHVAISEVLARPAPEAWRAFLREWYGIHGSGGVVPQVAMPRALREFYEFAGTAKRAFELNDLLAPDDIWTDAGHRVFYVEEQSVWLWGIAEGDWLADDPSVWGRENGPGTPWLQDAPSVSVFLVQMLVMSAALIGPHAAHAAWLREAEAEAALGSLSRLDLPPWHWPGSPARWYAGEDAVAFACPNIAPGEDPGGKPLSVWISAVSQDAITFVEPHLSDAWDYYSPRDG
jgi:hypothetical protein